MPQKFLLISSLMLLFILTLPSPSSPAATEKPATGKLVSVSGKVTVFGEAGKPGRTAKKGAKVAEGERIITAEDATAVLELFDGSQLTLQAGTDLSLVQLKKSPTQGNMLKFKLALGKILAEIAKMISVNSRFEIESGGVVCGVRGTKFTLQYDPGPKKLSLKVSEGSVYADSGGKRLVVNAGGQLEFLKGKPVSNENASKPAEGDAAKSQTPGYADPALADLHGQFSGENRSYKNRALNDPAAAGTKVRLNPNPNASKKIGVIEAKP